MMNSLDRGLYLESIEPVIKEKTDLIIPKKYEILENSRRNEDRDGYGIGLIIKYQESEEKYITEQILNSMDSKSDKGIWRYYENGFDFGQSANLLVATSRETQIDRLKNRNAWDDNTVEAVLTSQMPIEAKLTLADMVFWNEGPVEILRNQCRRFLRSIECKS